MADCQALAESYNMDADLYFLTGETALAMDSYEEASSNFEQAYGEDATYDVIWKRNYPEMRRMRRITVTEAVFIITWMIMKTRQLS